MKIERIFAALFVLALALFPQGVSYAAPAGDTPYPASRVSVIRRGATFYTPPPSAAQEVLGSVPNDLAHQVANLPERDLPHRSAAERALTEAAQTAAAPLASPLSISTAQAGGFKGWKGLSHYDQRMANGGNQFSTEPPDQGLCVGSGYVVEMVNVAMIIYGTDGKVKKAVTDLNTFFKLPNAINRSTSVIGPSLTDPRCVYDPLSSRWFLSVLTLDTDPSTGGFSGPSHYDIAVSKTSNPTGGWYLYRIDTTNGDGSLPGHAGCPCFGDQPLIGVDANAFVITGNEFSVAGPDFNGAQIYVLPKALMLAGQPVFSINFDRLNLGGGLAYSVQPAAPGSKSSVESGSGGTEYFLSTLDFNNTSDSRIALWALTNTASLTSAAPSLSLHSTALNGEAYGGPPNAKQKSGSLPLGASLKAGLSMINANDDRINQVEFIGGKLYSTVETLVSVKGKAQAGIAYYVISPTLNNLLPEGTIARQGYLAVAGNNLLFPSIAVTSAGKAVVTFTLVGPGYYPSAAYAVLTSKPVVRIAAKGVLPADGLSGYSQYGGSGVERWGDYSSAVTDGKNIWMAVEFIPGGKRTQLANWGTYVFKVTP